MNTDYLREFVVFAGHMNFTTAAKTLSMSQPTLSRHVSELERYYGCPLVDRNSSCLRLTHCGKTLLEQAPELIAQEHVLSERMAAAAREPYGNLVIQRYRKSPLIQELLARTLNALKPAHPGFAFTRRALKPGDTADEAVLRGDIDVGIVACTTDRTPTCPCADTDGIAHLPLRSHRERLFFVLPAASPLSRQRQLSLEDLAAWCFVFPLNPEFSRCQPDIARLFAERGLRLRSRPHELEEVEELGLMGIGPNEVFIVVESAATAPDGFYLHNPELAILPCADPIWVTRYLIWRSDDRNPALQALLGEMAGFQAERSGSQQGHR